MRCRSWSTILSTVLVVLVGAAATLSSADAAMARTQTCSTKGLRFSYKSGSATYSVRVSSLKATGATCVAAVSVSTVAAKVLLHKKTAPARIEGFTVHVKAPCAGCTPVWHVTATQGTSRITFEVLGGA